MFSKAEVMRADEARLLQRKMGYPSAGQLIRQIQQGKIETKVTANDVINNVYIFGKSVGELKGKTGARKQEAEIPLHIPMTETPRNQQLYIDIMFENKLSFLVCVFKPLGYTYVGLLKSRKGVDIWTQLNKGLRQVYNKGFIVTIAYMDGEKGVDTDVVQTLVWNNFKFELDLSGAAEAISVVENKIKHIKERMRDVILYLIRLIYYR